MKAETINDVVSQLDGVRDGLSSEAYSLQAEARALRHVGMDRIAERLEMSAAQISLYSNDMMDYQGVIVDHLVKSADQSSLNMLNAALAMAERK